MDEQRLRPDWDRVDDATLVAHLGAALRRHEQPPSALVDLAKASFGLRRLDAEVAALVADSLDTTTGPRVRAVRGSRLVTFETGSLAVELEATPEGSGWRIVGQLDPPGTARIELRHPVGPGTDPEPDPAPPPWAAADSRGRFALDVPGSRPLSLLCRREGLPDVATAWILLGS